MEITNYKYIMNISNYLKRFNDLYSLYGMGGGKIWYWIDWMMAFVLNGASFYDYFAYGFYKKRFVGRSDYMTWRRHSYVQKVYNNPQKISVMRDKKQFNDVFKQFLGRESCDLSLLTKKDFVSFFQKHKEIFVKDVFGLCGRGIGVYNIEKCQPEKLYEDLKRESKVKYLIESCMHQHSDISKLHPWSINTIRIVTLYNKQTNNVDVVCARQRIGNKKNRVDNFHQDGLCAVIDVETGVITSVGYDKNGKKYVCHPLTNVVIPGFQEPNWEECKRFVCELARVEPEVGYVGWDIVSQQDGSFAVIEGNDNADHDVQQIDGNGIWPIYKALLNKKV